MSAAERIERGRDEASFADVFTDEEHDHAAESARDGIGHVEAAAIEKDYAAPKRKGRAKDGRRAIIAEGAAVEGDSSEAPNGATAKAGAPATARTVVSGRKSGTDDSSAIHANKGSGRSMRRPALSPTRCRAKTTPTHSPGRREVSGAPGTSEDALRREPLMRARFL